MTTMNVYYKPVGIDPGHGYLTEGREYLVEEDGERHFTTESDRGDVLFCLKPGRTPRLCAHLEGQGQWVRVVRDSYYGGDDIADESADA